MAFTTRSNRKFDLLPLGTHPVGPGQYDPQTIGAGKKSETFAPFGSTSERVTVSKSLAKVCDETEGSPDPPRVLLVGNQSTPGPDAYSPKLDKTSFISRLPRKLAPFASTGKRSELMLQSDGAPVFYQTVYSAAVSAPAKTFGPKPRARAEANVTSAPSIPVDRHEEHRAALYDVAPAVAQTKQAAPRACFGRMSRFADLSTASTLGPGAYYEESSNKRRRWFEYQPSAAFRSTSTRAPLSSKSTDTLAAPGSYDVRGSLLKSTSDTSEFQFFSSTAPRFPYKELEQSLRSPGPGEYGEPTANAWLRGNRGVKISAPVAIERPAPRHADLTAPGGIAARSLEMGDTFYLDEEPLMRATMNSLAKTGSLGFISHSDRFPDRKAVSTPSDIVIPDPGEYEAGGTPDETSETGTRKKRGLLRIPIRHEIRKQEKFQPPPVGYYESHILPNFEVQKKLADKEGFLTTSRRFNWEQSRNRVLAPESSVEVFDLIDPRDPNASMSITLDAHRGHSTSLVSQKPPARPAVSRGLADMSNPRGFLSSVARDKLLDSAATKRQLPGPGDYDVPRSEFVKKNFNTLFGDVA